MDLEERLNTLLLKILGEKATVSIYNRRVHVLYDGAIVFTLPKCENGTDSAYESLIRKKCRAAGLREIDA